VSPSKNKMVTQDQTAELLFYMRFLFSRISRVVRFNCLLIFMDWCDKERNLKQYEGYLWKTTLLQGYLSIDHERPAYRLGEWKNEELWPLHVGLVSERGKNDKHFWFIHKDHLDKAKDRCYKAEGGIKY